MQTLLFSRSDDAKHTVPQQARQSYLTKKFSAFYRNSTEAPDTERTPTLHDTILAALTLVKIGLSFLHFVCF